MLLLLRRRRQWYMCIDREDEVEVEVVLGGGDKVLKEEKKGARW